MSRGVARSRLRSRIGTATGRVATVRLEDESGSIRIVAGDEFQSTLGLPSTLFEVTRVD